MNFFSPPFTKENIERQYKILAKALHPDKGGSEELFKELCTQKETVLNITKRKPVKMMHRPVSSVNIPKTKKKNKITSDQVQELISSANQLLKLVKKLRKL